jgi:hypothetical protein
VREGLENYGIAWTDWDCKGSFDSISGPGKPQPALIRVLADSN